MADEPTAITPAPTTTIVARDAGWRQLLPLVRLLARQAAAEAVGECINQNTPSTEEPTR